MSITVTWDYHNGPAQADIPVAWDDGDTGRETGQQTVFEWRWRADPADAWSAPLIQIIDMPATTTYTPPGDGFVQMVAYSILAGLVSWQGCTAEFEVSGGELAAPAAYTDESSANYEDEIGNPYMDKD